MWIQSERRMLHDKNIESASIVPDKYLLRKADLFGVTLMFQLLKNEQKAWAVLNCLMQTDYSDSLQPRVFQ